MSPTEFLERLQRSEHYRGQLAACRRFPARAARYGELERPLVPAVEETLRGLGIERFYSHQAAAINAARAGESVTVVTSTASGKTLCFNVPVVERLVERPAARALYLYPTKALAQDQLGKLDRWSAAASVRAATYDGDTPPDERRWVRRAARVILSNPDMLHVSILPNHPSWSSFLANLDYVVLDELHTYRGIFGSHVATVLRRLRRLCEHYGSRPQFICTSATIANPLAHAAALTGLETMLIADDGAPAPEKWFALWNTPLLSPATGERGSAIAEATWIFAEMARGGLKNITFTRARVVAELVLRYAQAALAAEEPDLSDRVAAYRAGYTPAQRRAIEQRLFHGDLVGVAATNALEFGVDVGALDAAVLVGYPGTIASTWQQAGRAGRAGRASLAVMVLQDNPLDQFLGRNPDYLFEGLVEQATVDPENPYILLRHAACAAAEKALGPGDTALFGADLPELADLLVEAGQLRAAGDRYYWCGTGYPAADVNIRAAGGEPYAIRSAMDASLLGTADAETAFQVVHPGAVYLHQGETYLVERLDLDSRTAYVQPVTADYYTTPRVSTTVRIVEQHTERATGSTTAAFGEVLVTRSVLGYRKHRLQTEQVLEQVDLVLPDQTYRTEALWFTLPAAVAAGLARDGADVLGAIHALEHTVVGVAPLHAMCDRYDLGGASHPLHPDLALPAVFLHDSAPGGVGIADRCFNAIDDLLRETLDLIAACPCESGCPACIHSPTCGSRNEPLDKRGAVLALQALLQPAPPPAGERPPQPDPAGREEELPEVAAASGI
jgi:DEAD/DEAH box helicase domain-containing protein